MSTQMRTSIITAMNAINDANLTTRHQKTGAGGCLSDGNVFPVRHTEINIMQQHEEISFAIAPARSAV